MECCFPFAPIGFRFGGRAQLNFTAYTPADFAYAETLFQQNQKMPKHNLANIFLRLGMAFVFFYAGIAGLLEPANWVGYLPQQFEVMAPRETLLVFFSIFEIALGLWLLTGFKTYYASIISALTLAGIIGGSLSILDITFRDVGLFFMALSLIILSKDKLPIGKYGLGDQEVNREAIYQSHFKDKLNIK